MFEYNIGSICNCYDYNNQQDTQTIRTKPPRIRAGGITFSTAAGKFSPVASAAPDTWNFASLIVIIPGFAANVGGVSVILSPFLSYAMYIVRGAGTGNTASVDVCAGAGD